MLKESMIKKKRQFHIDRLKLTHPQKEGVIALLSMQKNKFKKLLHETHERMHVIVDHVRTLEIWVNVNGDYEYVSPGFETLTGRNRIAFLKKEYYFQSLIHPDSAEQYRNDRTLMYAGHEAMEGEYKLVHASGAVKTIRVWWRPVHTRKGRHIGIRLSILDLTAARAGQEVFSALSDLMFASSRACLLVSPDGTIQRMNDAARAWTDPPLGDQTRIGSCFPELTGILPSLTMRRTVSVAGPPSSTLELLPLLDDESAPRAALVLLPSSL